MITITCIIILLFLLIRVFASNQNESILPYVVCIFLVTICYGIFIYYAYKTPTYQKSECYFDDQTLSVIIIHEVCHRVYFDFDFCDNLSKTNYPLRKLIPDLGNSTIEILSD